VTAGVHPTRVTKEERPVPEYRVEYGDADNMKVETIVADEIVREDGIVTFFKDGDSILRAHESNIHNLADLPVED
jgi:hypothetical protein